MGAEWAREAGAGALRVSKQEPALLTLGSWVHWKNWMLKLKLQFFGHLI